MSFDIPQRSSLTIIVKAAPRVGKSHGELVCCAGFDDTGKWVRLYPVSFRSLEDAQKFQRWDIVEYNWRLPKGDNRKESRRVEHASLFIKSKVKSAKAKTDMIAPLVARSLDEEDKQGRSLAFIRPKNPNFFFQKKSIDQFNEEKDQFLKWHNDETNGLFSNISKKLMPYEPSPYLFKYSYDTADGKREGTCQDWEIEATFLKWRRHYGEDKALKQMKNVFGEEYPSKGFVLAMGTHKAYGNWLINGVIRLDNYAEDNAQDKLL
ncbi:hypothetical protein [Agrobacterium vitis]|uniref:hypothetical protein n=1 Tax=Agrobacterium vitis TaxID=373 RepID=UPI00114CB17F|nr:hypothetical protein [Agrobacterium vitis]MCE6073731.1 hypothetical protein [Agrobacterium vitis]MCM2468560.1 hypothetical protein [Agrobacterium vitis]MUO72072.1 hypothetical protein [Agrobacterium vitis]MUO85619.1 hypothetical protein [Agrobacterium vitis]